MLFSLNGSKQNAVKYCRFGQDKAQTDFSAIQWLDGNIISKSGFFFFFLVKILSTMKSWLNLCEDLVSLVSVVCDQI